MTLGLNGCPHSAVRYNGGGGTRMRDVEIKKIHEALKNSLASARVESNKWLHTHTRTHAHTHTDIVPSAQFYQRGSFYCTPWQWSSIPRAYTREMLTL
jgi:hypothetical protein